MPGEVISMVVPETVEGEYAFKKYANPMAMASEFGVAPQPTQEGILAQALAEFAASNYFDDRLLIELEQVILLTQDQGQQALAAENLTASFGEVKANDRHNIAVLAVYFALVHNETVASEQLQDTSIWLEKLLLQAELQLIELIDQITEKEKQLRSQALHDQRAQQQFQKNTYEGYSANQANAQFGKGLVERLMTADQRQLEQLKAEKITLERGLAMLYNLQTIDYANRVI